MDRRTLTDSIVVIKFPIDLYTITINRGIVIYEKSKTSRFSPRSSFNF